MISSSSLVRWSVVEALVVGWWWRWCVVVESSSSSWFGEVTRSSLVGL
ncbi:hypothetical protein ACXZ9C_11830 [Streptococcus agalactiae]